MWLAFIILGLWVAVVWSLLAYCKIGLLPRVIIAVIVSTVMAGALFIFTIPGESFLDDVPWYQTSPYREAIAFILMLFGMASRYITKAIEERRSKLAAKQYDAGLKPGIEFDPWEFSYPLFVSVITFGVLLQQMGDEKLTLANLILSFQTGFFWQTLLAKSSESQVSRSIGE